MDPSNPRNRTHRTEPFAAVEKTYQDIERMSADEIQALIEELRVHQFELEVQNGQLRNMQLELEETRDRYFDLYNFAPVGYLTLDATGRILEANLAAATLLAADRRSLLEARLSSFITRNRQDAWYLYLQRFSAVGVVHRCEFELVRADGSSLFVQLEGISVRVEARREMRIMVCITNITGHKQLEKALRELTVSLEQRVAERTRELEERNRQLQSEIAQRRRSEEVLRESERRFRAVFDQHYQLAGLLTPEGILLAANRRALELAGLEEADVVGRPFWETPWWTHSPELQRRLREAIDDAAKGKLIQFESTHPRADGTWAVVNFTIRPVRDEAGNVVLLVPESHDISEYRQALEAARRGEGWLRSLIETTQDAVVSIDRRGCVVLFNPAAERIFGYGRSEVQGRKVNMLMAEPYATEHDSYIERYEKTREPHAVGRIRTVEGRRKNGEIFPLELSVTEIETDEEIRYAAFMRDISEKKRLESQLIERERLAAVGATAAGVAHEIANPLNSIAMTIELVERKLARLDDPAGRDLAPRLQSIKGEIQRLTELLADFSSLARKRQHELEPCCLETLCTRALEMEEEKFGKSAIRVETSFPPDLKRPSLEKNTFQQVLINLFKNAAEAMPGGGILSVRAWNEPQRVVLEIGDTGRGVPEGIDIFEPFKTTKQEGSGLGLAITRKIVADHGGTITYESQPGEGTLFRLELPIRVQA